MTEDTPIPPVAQDGSLTVAVTSQVIYWADGNRCLGSLSRKRQATRGNPRIHFADMNSSRLMRLESRSVHRASTWRLAASNSEQIDFRPIDDTVFFRRMVKMNGANWQTGYIHVYTGDGKGKTTAALGLALRAAGAGLDVFIGQFIKGLRYNEIDALQRYKDRITIQQFGRGCFIFREPENEDQEAARQGLNVAHQILQHASHRVVILDEINVAVQCGLCTVNEVLSLIDAKPSHVELVLTGRGASPEVLARADLITEMQAVRHYYQNGIEARVGIEK